MQETKYFLSSKRFWGAVLSVAGFALVTFGNLVGQDYTALVEAIGKVTAFFGITMATYGGAVAEKPLGFSKQ